MRLHLRSVLLLCLTLSVALGVPLLGPRAVRAEQTQISPEEYAALVAVYDAMGGPQWTTPWTLPSDTPCRLPGVQCAGSTGPYEAVVVSLDLSANGLTGAIPPAIAGLSHLTDLDLSENALTGEIPAALGTLSALRWLDLGVNQLSGPIPPVLGDLGNLQFLIANDNQLSGPLPPELGNLTSLVALSLYNNELSGVIPAALGGMSALTNVDLARNALSGPIPSELGNLVYLDTLNLGGNALSGPIPDALGDLSRLRFLFLFDNQLEGPIPDALGQIAGLSSLSLGGNHLEGPIPEALSALSDLWLLSLAGNRLSGPVPEYLGSLERMYWLDLEYNALSGPLPTSLANLTDLFWLRLGYNMLWTDDPALEAFLAEKDPYWDTTQTRSPTDIEAAPTGRGARVTWTPRQDLAGDGYYEVGVATSPGGPYAPAAPTASLWERQVTIRGLEPGQTYYVAVRTYRPGWGQQQNDLLTGYSDEVSVVPAPYDIPVSEYEALVAFHEATGGPEWTAPWALPAEDPCSLYGVTCSAGHVTRLRLRANGLRGALPEALAALPGLIELDLSGNSLSGVVPAALGDLPRLAILRLGANALCGPLPAALGGLERLGDLDLQRNMLWTDDAALQAFLDLRSPGWGRTQTVPPANLSAAPIAGGARLSWTPGASRVDGGYYEVGVADTAGGPYAPAAGTSDRAAGGIEIQGLAPGRTHYLAVRAHAPAQAPQLNALTSPYGMEVSVTLPHIALLPMVCR